MKEILPHTHGVVRGIEGVGRSPRFEGRFGRMFRTLAPARFDEKDLKSLAAAMVAEAEDPPTSEDQIDAEENVGKDPKHPAISAGYTYLGQFIDHDLTFDPASSLQKQNDPDALVDFRTPRFDLDCVYGRGPDDQPYLYEDNGVRMLLGRKLTGNADDPKARDVPRNSPEAGPKRALIGDPRNDENVIVSQLHAAFLRFHNRLVDLFHGPHADFRTIQRLVRWHYQWVVLFDFLPTIIGQDALRSILPHLDASTGNRYTADLRFYTPRNEPFIPVEFSVAAYRFGHSMVRPIYRLNATAQRLPIFPTRPGMAALTGFGEFRSDLAINWKLFFDFGAGGTERGPGRIQPAYKIDTSLVNPLGNLPLSVAMQVSSLAERNLLRGLRMGLPSGQDVARRMGIAPIPDEKLKVGKAIEPESGAIPDLRLIDISPKFRGNAPLWYYILADSQKAFHDNTTPIRLGQVAGRIVGEVFVGLLKGDRHSFLNQEPLWQPIPEFLNNGKFGMAELIAQAMRA